MMEEKIKQVPVGRFEMRREPIRTPIPTPMSQEEAAYWVENGGYTLQPGPRHATLQVKVKNCVYDVVNTEDFAIEWRDTSAYLDIRRDGPWRWVQVGGLVERDLLDGIDVLRVVIA